MPPVRFPHGAGGPRRTKSEAESFSRPSSSHNSAQAELRDETGRAGTNGSDRKSAGIPGGDKDVGFCPPRGLDGEVETDETPHADEPERLVRSRRKRVEGG